MKTIIRASVVLLALTGSAAYTQLHLTDSSAITAKANSRPIPMCPPDDPSACGIYK